MCFSERRNINLMPAEEANESIERPPDLESMTSRSHRINIAPRFDDQNSESDVNITARNYGDDTHR